MNESSKAECIQPISTGTTGAMSELLVAAELMAQRYLVARNLSPNGKADLIVWKPGELYLVDVKTYATPQVLRTVDAEISIISPGNTTSWAKRVNLLALSKEDE